MIEFIELRNALRISNLNPWTLESSDPSFEKGYVIQKRFGPFYAH